jgi:hypothetical protein
MAVDVVSAANAMASAQQWRGANRAKVAVREAAKADEMSAVAVGATSAAVSAQSAHLAKMLLKMEQTTHIPQRQIAKMAYRPKHVSHVSHAKVERVGAASAANAVAVGAVSVPSAQSSAATTQMA